jgi:hypothetical protein
MSEPTDSIASVSDTSHAGPPSVAGPTEPARRRWFWVLTSAVALVALLWVRMAVDSHAACDEAETAAAGQDTDGEISSLRHAIESWAPLGTCATEAADRLTRIADAAEASGNVETALFALRAQRTALLSIRHLWVPQGHRLEQLHPRIGRLMAVQVGGSPDVQQANAARYTQQLDAWRERGPRVPVAFAASLAFAGWLVTLVLGAQRGFHAEGGVRGTAWPWAVANVVLLVTWLSLVRLA